MDRWRVIEKNIDGPRFVICLVQAVLLSLFLAFQPDATAAAWFDAAAVDAVDEAVSTVFANAVDLTQDAQGAHSVETADLDGDGDLDAISASRQDGKIRWFRNEGSGTAFTPITVESVPGAYLAIAGDVDGDADADLIVAAVTEVRPSALAQEEHSPTALASGTVLWYENDGQSSPAFQRHIVYGSLKYPVSLHSADLDGDGDLDLMSASRDDNRVLWYENDGNRDEPRFTTHTLADNALGAVSVHTADFDNDGDLDVVSASEDDDQIAWYENRGSQPSQFVPHVIRYTSKPLPLLFDYAKSVHGADVDGDGDQDIVYGSEEDNLLGWYENIGGAPPQFQQRTIDTRSDHAKFVTANDVDLDGDIDLFIASTNDQTVAWYENDGAPDPQFRRHVVTDQALGARYIHIADLDGDGDMDVLTASRDDNRITWYRNRTIHRSAYFPAGSARAVAVEPGSQVVQAGDMDNDGDPDLISIGDRRLSWHENQNGPVPTFVSHVIDANFSDGRWVRSDDLDRDGDSDIVFVAGGGETIGWYENNGQTPPGFSSHPIDANAGGVYAAPTADVDGDGDLDIIAASPTATRIAWYENVGGATPTFALHVVSEDAAGAQTVAAADINRDGRLDLVSTSNAGDSVDWYENQGGRPPTLIKRSIADNMGGVQKILTADLNRDGKTDLLAASEANAALVWYRNAGGTPLQFQRHVVASSDFKIRAMETQDLDQDGDLDIVAANGDGNLLWYANSGQTTPTFTRRTVHDVVTDFVAVTDLDSDGDQDLLAVADSNDAVTWSENQGGQYGITASAVPSSWFSTLQPGEVASYAVAHRGRWGDGAIELTTLEVVFSDAQQGALSTEQIQQCLSGLYIYRDAHGYRRYEPTEDGLIASMAPVVLEPGGRVTFNLSAIDGGMRALPDNDLLLFVAGEFKENCDQHAPGYNVSFAVTRETARDSATGALVSAEEYGANGQVNPQTMVSAPALFINEVDTGEGDWPQQQAGWIEIYNAEFAPLDLGGMYLSNDPADPTRYRIPDGVSIPPHGYRVFVTDGQPNLGPAHTNFNLSDGRTTLALHNNDGWAQRLIDSVTVDRPPANRSTGRYPDGSQNWTDLAPSPEMYNHKGDLPFKTFLPIRVGVIGSP